MRSGRKELPGDGRLARTDCEAYPTPLQERIQVVKDGSTISPNPGSCRQLPSGERRRPALPLDWSEPF